METMVVDTAIPCGLIINELVSNAIKHAFPDSRAGTIDIQLRPEGETMSKLIVRDNGVGFPKDVNFRNMDSLGMKLIMAWVEQIEGNIRLRGNGGTEFEVIFAISDSQGKLR